MSDDKRSGPNEAPPAELHELEVEQVELFPRPEMWFETGPVFINPGCLDDGLDTSAPPLINLTGHEYLSAKQIAIRLGVPYDSLRRRLERFRDSPAGDRATIQNKEPKVGQPKYLYELNAVVEEISTLQKGKNVHRGTIYYKKAQ